MSFHSAATFFGEMLVYYNNHNADKMKNLLKDAITPERFKFEANYTEQVFQSQKSKIDKNQNNFVEFCLNFYQYLIQRDSKDQKEDAALRAYVEAVDKLRNYFEEMTENEDWFLPIIKFIIMQSKNIQAQIEMKNKLTKKEE